jgi:hypothetical protein
MDDAAKLAQLEEKLAQYMPVYLEKKRNFRGVKHENSLSELRYTEFMVYREMVESLQKEIRVLKAKLGKR